MIMNRVGAGFIALAVGLPPGIRLSLLIFWRVLLTVLGTMAQDSSKCSVSGTYYHTIERQAEVDGLVESGCSELDGQIIIKQAYSGPFSFPGLTNMTGHGIQLEEGSRVTLIDFPDLEAVGQVYVSKLGVSVLT
jgi:hypothetical protein